MKKILLLLCLFSVFTTSCRKLGVYPEDSDSTLGTTSKLIVGTWKLTGARIKEVSSDGKTREYDSFPTYDPCELDDVITYSSNQAYLLDYGSNSCDPSDPASITGAWTISRDNKLLTVTFPPNDYIENLTTEIVSVNSTTLITKFTIGINDVDFTNTLTFTRVK